MYRTRSERRHTKRVHKLRDLAIIAANRCYYMSGMWFDEEKGRVVHPGRGKRSRYLKTACARTLRRKMNSNLEYGLSEGGHYKKVTEFWYELD